MAAKNRDVRNPTAPSEFDEQAAMAALAHVKSAEDVKREQFQACVKFVQMASEKDVSWDKIADAISEHGGPNRLLKLDTV